MEYGCIGRKLSHSFSKIIHSRLCDYDYILKELEPQQLEQFMKERGFKGINVTIPYKQDVMPYLDVISDTAKAIGAVNTIVNKNGRLYGYNTDFSGMRALARRTGIDFKGKKTVILGSGGTSKTALALAKSENAGAVLRVSRFAKDGCITYDELYAHHTDAQIIINTTPCGMFPDTGSAAVELTRFQNVTGVLDAVYNPLRSRLIMQALGRGIPASGGLYMLVAQAVSAADKFTDRKFNGQEKKKIYNSILSEKQNIVLIGMPGCGKTTLGKAIAEKLGREFTDTDDEIVKRENMPIPEIFAKGSEPLFRKIESEVIASVSQSCGIVIATGGGAVLNPANAAALRQNGRLCFINRPLDSLPVTDSRPLSDDRQKLMRLYETRLPVYRAVCDFEIAAGNDIMQNTDLILKEYGFES